MESPSTGKIAEMSAFAMRLLRILLVLLLLTLPGVSAQAQVPDLGVYQVTDVASDVTADSAAHARDQAIIQAQRIALEQLAEMPLWCQS
jgi:hypothetical protein